MKSLMRWLKKIFADTDMAYVDHINGSCILNWSRLCIILAQFKEEALSHQRQVRIINLNIFTDLHFFHPYQDSSCNKLTLLN